jgi:hypothetical protein
MCVWMRAFWPGLVEFLLDQRLLDGGFNCNWNRSGAWHSAMHTTCPSWRGSPGYEHSGNRYRLDELVAAGATAVDFLLRHRLYRSERTGRLINAEFTRLHHPARWHFDVLRGLDALVEARVGHDPRMDDALDVIAARRQSDGRWLANKAYPGAKYLPPVPAGEPSPWITLVALRILKTYGGDRRSTAW